MKYPKLLQKGDIIGICAPSSGASGDVLSKRSDNAVSNIKALGYNVVEAASVRSDVKCVSADSATRAAEFMSLYENPYVAAILPPWGGDFLSRHRCRLSMVDWQCGVCRWQGNCLPEY